MSEKLISEGNYNFEFSDAALLCAEVEVVDTLAGRFDSTIHSTSFSCNVNWGVKNAKDSS
jgi:hypothetical protein